MAKTYEEILDEMPNRVKECNAMEGSFIYTALAPFAMELALLYLQLEEDEKNGFADTADYEHLKRLALDRGIIPNQATHAVGIGKFGVEIPEKNNRDGLYYFFQKITGTDLIIFFTSLTHPKHLLKRLNTFFYLKCLVRDYLLKTTFFGNLSIKKSTFFDHPNCQKSTFFDHLFYNPEKDHNLTIILVKYKLVIYTWLFFYSAKII